MSIKSSLNKVSSIVFFFIITKIECWPIFKQDPKGSMGKLNSEKEGMFRTMYRVKIKMKVDKY